LLRWIVCRGKGAVYCIAHPSVISSDEPFRGVIGATHRNAHLSITVLMDRSPSAKGATYLSLG